VKFIRSMIVLLVCAFVVVACQEKKEGEGTTTNPPEGTTTTKPPQPPPKETVSEDVKLACGAPAIDRWEPNPSSAKFDVDVEYWSIGTCKAYVLPAMEGAGGGVATTDSVAGGDHMKKSLKKATNLKFGCRAGESGDCFFRVNKAVAAGTNPPNSVTPDPKFPHCSDGSSPVILDNRTNCDVVVKAVIPAGCTGKVWEDGSSSPSVVSGTKLVSFTGVKKILASCDGKPDESGATCSFQARALCAD
jgi:hypothetical protein